LSQVVVNQVGVDEALEVLLGLLLLQVDDGDLTIRNGLRLLLAGAGIRITVGNVGEWNQVVLLIVFILIVERNNGALQFAGSVALLVGLNGLDLCNQEGRIDSN